MKKYFFLFFFTTSYLCFGTWKEKIDISIMEKELIVTKIENYKTREETLPSKTELENLQIDLLNKEFEIVTSIKELQVAKRENTRKLRVFKKKKELAVKSMEEFKRKGEALKNMPESKSKRDIELISYFLDYYKNEITNLEMEITRLTIKMDEYCKINESINLGFSTDDYFTLYYDKLINISENQVILMKKNKESRNKLMEKELEIKTLNTKKLSARKDLKEKKINFEIDLKIAYNNLFILKELYEIKRKSYFLMLDKEKSDIVTQSEVFNSFKEANQVEIDIIELEEKIEELKDELSR